MPEGATTWPTDSAGNTGVGPRSTDSNHYHFRSDANRNLKVGIFDSADAVQGSVANPLEVRAGGAVAITEATPTISTSIYAAGDNIGGKISLTSAVRVSGGSGIIQSVRIVDQGNQKTEKDIVFFAADPTGTTFTDNAALDVADADMDKIIGYVKVVAGDYISFSDNAVGYKTGLGMPFKLATGTTLYATIVERGTPTYPATSDLILEVGAFQD